MARQGKLTDTLRTDLVIDLACYVPLSVAGARIRKAGVEISNQSLQGYDPSTHAGRNLSPRWRKLFEETRAAFLKDTASIGISHRGVRLRRLERMSLIAESRGQFALAAQLLRQAAEEMGGLLTNRREFAGFGDYQAPSLASFYGREPMPGANHSTAKAYTISLAGTSVRGLPESSPHAASATN